jgi:hypothetical protein
MSASNERWSSEALTMNVLCDVTRGRKRRVGAKLAVVVAALTISSGAFAGGPPSAAHTVDLRAPHALDQLRRIDPARFRKLQEILDGLREQPKRAEGDWLQVNFKATDVDLSRYLFRTSYPPKQLLRFTLDDFRYVVYVTRDDLNATVTQADDAK